MKRVLFYLLFLLLSDQIRSSNLIDCEDSVTWTSAIQGKTTNECTLNTELILSKCPGELKTSTYIQVGRYYARLNCIKRIINNHFNPLKLFSNSLCSSITLTTEIKNQKNCTEVIKNELLTQLGDKCLE